ncbi:hypothetical protein JCM5353_000321 [Sporobolomyces roseus]
MTSQVTLPKKWECLSSSLVPEVKVWVTMGDKVLATHKKDTTNRAHVTAEIAGIEGKEFQVHFYDGRTKLTKPFEYHLFLDGERVQGYYVTKDAEKYTTSADHEDRSRIFIDDKTKALKSSDAISQIGTIVIKYRRIKAIKVTTVKSKTTTASSMQTQVPIKTQNTNLIDEKLKKAQFGLAATLGDLRPQSAFSTSAATASSSASASSATATILNEPESTTKTTYDLIDTPTPFITYQFNIRSATVIQDELFVDEELDSPVASTSGSSKRNSTALEGDDEEDDEDIEAQLKALEEKRARLLAKKAKTEDIKPKVSPPPPFDWQGKPPIDLGKRIYVDFEGGDARVEEEKEVERERLTKERVQKGRIELD